MPVRDEALLVGVVRLPALLAHFPTQPLGQDEERRNQLRGSNQPNPAQLEVKVRCNSHTQYVGMAKYDLYLRQDDPSGGAEKWLFAANFFKGAFGLWLRLGLVLGIAVTLSTYLSGVISLILTGVLYFGGMSLEFIKSVAFGTNGNSPNNLVGILNAVGTAAKPSSAARNSSSAGRPTEWRPFTPPTRRTPRGTTRPR